MKRNKNFIVVMLVVSIIMSYSISKDNTQYLIDSSPLSEDHLPFVH